jgi:hypothetical protein
MLDRISAAPELQLARVGAKQIAVFDLASQFGQMLLSFCVVHARQRSVYERRNVRMPAVATHGGDEVLAVVWTASLPLRGGDPEVVTVNTKRRGVPLGGNEARGPLRGIGGIGLGGIRGVKDRYRIESGGRNE